MNWDDIEVKEFGKVETLPVGNYVMKILNVKEDKTLSERPRLVIQCDVETGDYKDFFKTQFDKDTRNDKKWPQSGIYSVLIDLDMTTLPFYKGFITAVENSNNTKFEIKEKDNKFIFDFEKLKGLKFGACYGLEEFQNDKGVIKTSNKIRFVRSVDKLDDTIVDVKLIDKTYMDYETYIDKSKKFLSEMGDIVEVKTEDLPF